MSSPPSRRGDRSSTSGGISQLRLIGIVSILTFGLTSLVAIGGLGQLSAVLFVLGFFILVPLIALLGEDFPYVKAEENEPQQPPRQDPVETLRDRFARGEIDQAEFERRLEYLVETEGLDFDVDEQLGHLSSERERPQGRCHRTREHELDWE